MVVVGGGSLGEGWGRERAMGLIILAGEPVLPMWWEKKKKKNNQSSFFLPFLFLAFLISFLKKEDYCWEKRTI